MIKVVINYGPNYFNAELQTKSFKDETAAVEFCRKHHDNIHSINGIPTHGEQLSHFEIIDAIRNKEDM